MSNKLFATLGSIRHVAQLEYLDQGCKGVGNSAMHFSHPVLLDA